MKKALMFSVLMAGLSMSPSVFAMDSNVQEEAYFLKHVNNKNKVLTVCLNNNNTVKDWKIKVFKEHGIPVEDQIFIDKGRIVKDDEKVNRNNNTLYLRTSNAPSSSVQEEIVIKTPAPTPEISRLDELKEKETAGTLSDDEKIELIMNAFMNS